MRHVSYNRASRGLRVALRSVRNNISRGATSLHVSALLCAQAHFISPHRRDIAASTRVLGRRAV